MTIDFLGYERLKNPPYSPNLAPMNFALFPRLKFESIQQLAMAKRTHIRRYELFGSKMCSISGWRDNGNVLMHVVNTLKKPDVKRDVALC